MVPGSQWNGRAGRLGRALGFCPGSVETVRPAPCTLRLRALGRMSPAES